MIVPCKKQTMERVVNDIINTSYNHTLGRSWWGTHCYVVIFRLTCKERCWNYEWIWFDLAFSREWIGLTKTLATHICLTKMLVDTYISPTSLYIWYDILVEETMNESVRKSLIGRHLDNKDINLLKIFIKEKKYYLLVTINYIKILSPQQPTSLTIKRINKICIICLSLIFLILLNTHINDTIHMHMVGPI